MSRRRGLVRSSHPLPVRRQCELLGVPRSTHYYRARPAPFGDLARMRRIDEVHLKQPFLGSRRIVDELEEAGLPTNRKRVQRLMRIMGITALYPKPRTSAPGAGHRVFPYLLRDLEVVRPNQVWASDITYVPMARGFLYLVAMMDWYSRRVLSWRLSNTLEADFCVSALEEALWRYPQPEIVNTDQGSQFTSEQFVSVLRDRGVAVSHDGRGRCHDNILVERLWRTVKYEDIYLRAYESGLDLHQGLDRYFRYYNGRRRHSRLPGRRTPDQIYFAAADAPSAA